MDPHCKSQPPTTYDTRSWQQLIWREWRNCSDREYAGHLFALVVHEAIDGQALIILGGVGSLYGALGGWLGTLMGYGLEAGVPALMGGIVIGAAVGGIGSLLLAYGLKSRRSFTWGAWLRGLIPAMPLISKPYLFPLPLYFRLLIGLGSGLGLGITGIFFFDQVNPPFFSLLAGLVGVAAGGIALKKWGSLADLILFGSVGLLFGLFFGVGFAQIFSPIFGPFEVFQSVQIVGLAVGLAVGLFIGQTSGLLGGLIWQALISGLVVLSRPDLILVSWLVGLLLGEVSGSIHRILSLPKSGFEFDDLYRHRHWYLWWRRRPAATDLEGALRRYARQPVWQEALERLTAQQQRLETAKDLWGYLYRSDWIEQFVGRHALATLGGEAIPELSPIAASQTHAFGQLAVWLIHSISAETTSRLAGQAAMLLCPNCLARCGPHRLKLARLPATYYGCRTCGQSRNFFICTKGVVAVLDTRWREPYRYQEGLLRVNWTSRNSLFDFDRLEIAWASDEQVERLAVQIGNDTDPVRRSQYAKMSCAVLLQCQLSENTLRILQRMLGKVERK